MPATTKTELIKVTQIEFEKLIRLVVQIDPETALRKDDSDTSIKDVIAHRAHWIDLFLGWYHDGQAGNPVTFPAPGYKWNDLIRYNADLRKRQQDLDWPDAIAMLNARYETFTQLINSLSDKELYGAPMQGAHNAWTTGRWAEAAGPSHFRSASKYLRARQRNT